jgi:hypothetical protein
VIEGGEVEPVGEHECARHEVAAAAADPERLCVTAGAGVRVRRRETVHVAREDERRGRVGQRRPHALRERPPAALLLGPHGGEDALPVREQDAQRYLELLAVCQVVRHGDLTADLDRPGRALVAGTGRRVCDVVVHRGGQVWLLPADGPGTASQQEQ